MSEGKYSVLGKIWSKLTIDEYFAKEVARHLGVSDLLAKLISRNNSSLEQAEKFFNPKIKSLLPDPFHLHDMQKGVDRVMKAISSQEKICIFADYDVDGATSSAILKNFFDEIGISAFIYVPDRIKEGYGPNNSAMEYIKQQGASLVITVDCGAVAFDAVDYAANLGLNVIIIDHHITLEKLPNAVATINPNRLDEPSEYKYLAAVGVSFLFLVALSRSLQQQNFFVSKNITPPNLLNQLDLVALGTVCDVMPITGLNRAFVAQGLKIIRNRTNPGLVALQEFAALEEQVEIYHLGFILGPRINAGGRVGKSFLGANLLSSKDSAQVLDFARQLEDFNQERKAVELRMLEEAKRQAELQQDEDVILIIGQGWHPGVIGIIAGRIKEQYNKPVAVIAVDDQGLGKASCRSVKGVDFGCKVLEAKNREILVAGGGHAMAAGFTVMQDKIPELKEFLRHEFGVILAKSQQHLQHYYDIDLGSDAINVELLQEIATLEPYGLGNPSPVFCFSNLYVLKADIVGHKHARILFAPERNSNFSKPIPAIAFNIIDTALQEVIFAKKPYSMNILGKLKLNKWQGNQSIQLILEDAIILK